MKYILVTQRVEKHSSYHEIRDMLDQQWTHFLNAADLFPILLPTMANPEKYLADLPIHGVLLTGGNDLNNINPNPLSQARDQTEKALIKCAIQREIPILGVCRGMQVLAAYFGATFRKVEGHVAQKHHLQRLTASRFNLKTNREVNSYHNYAIDQCPTELTALAASEDGVLEALEHKKHPIYAQMWHPERDTPFCQDELDLFRNFFGRKP